MKKLQYQSMLIVVMFCICGTVAAEDSLETKLPTLKKITTNGSAAFESSSGYYYYSYSFENDMQNLGDIFQINLDISIPNGAITFDTIGLKFDRQYVEQTFRRDFLRFTESLLPVGVLKLPSRKWSARVTNSIELSFSVVEQLPRPGEKLKGIVIMSRGIPVIRRITLKPWFEESKYLPDLDDPKSNLSISQMDSIRNLCDFHGTTIGPSAPPLSFRPIIWIDTLISYKHQSRLLGWIDNDGIVNSLDQKLENVKKQLEKGNTNSALGILQAFINEVEGQNGKHLTSEAYALLKYNAEYLVEKLGGQK